ncbi:MAG: hypothetical protein ACPG31_07440 [Planctomycetota bacterium]
MAHAHDLRVEVGEPTLADALLQSDWRQAPLEAAELALCAYAEKLTRTPQDMVEKDVEALRAAGWSDLEIHDACQVVAYFNYVNRLADGLGVDLEGESEEGQG